MLRIEHVRARAVSLPLKQPVISSIHNIDRVGCLIVEVETSAGVVGEGLLFTLNDYLLRLMQTMVEEFAPIVVGEDAEATEHVWSKLWGRVQFFGSGGFLIFGISAIDMALWDAIGKHQKRSMRQLFGGGRTHVPVYASDALFVDRSIDQLAEEARRLVADGYTAMKIRLAGRSIDDDVARVRTVREAVGDGITLMADANQALDLNKAIALGRRLEEFSLAWFEEPMPAHRFEDYALLCAALDTPIATGESNYTRLEFKRLIDMRGADILMPDLSRIGGPTELRKVAALAEASDIAVTPHLYPEHSVGIVGALPNATYVEHMSWFSPLFKEKLVLSNGGFEVPDRPGFGFTVDPEVVSRFGV